MTNETQLGLLLRLSEYFPRISMHTDGLIDKCDKCGEQTDIIFTIKVTPTIYKESCGNCLLEFLNKYPKDLEIMREV